MRLTTINTDPARIEAAQRLLARSAVEARQADATALPFAEESFDMVLSFLMLHHVIDWEQAVAGSCVSHRAEAGHGPSRIRQRQEGALNRARLAPVLRLRCRVCGFCPFLLQPVEFRGRPTPDGEVPEVRHGLRAAFP